MWVKQLQVLDFRNYERGDVAFEPGPNVLVGANGHGKTNLVEAVGYLATLSSHRVSSDTPLVRRDQARAFIRAVVVNDGRELLLELEINPGKANRAKLNRSAVPRVRDIAGLVRTVLFAPEDLELVRGDPGERRRFLDDLLVVRTPRFAGVRQDYDRVLRQRNTLLRTAGFARRAGRSGDLRTLEVWDGQLARTGAELLVGRRQLVADLRPFVEEAYAVVSGAAEPAGLAYRSSVEVDDGAGDNGPADDAGTAATDVPPIDAVPTLAEAETALLEALARVGAAEVERGVTLVGPHRDELVLSLDGYPAKGFASHGQSWSVALALRLASYDLLRGEGPEPVLVLDDVFAELDVRRREQLATLALGAEQTLITAAVASDVPESLRARTLHVVSGRVTNPLDPP